MLFFCALGKYDNMKLTKHLLVLLSCSLLLWSCQPASNDANTNGAVATNHQAAVTSFSQWFDNPVPLVSAHRGGPYAGYPENALETFQYIANHTPTVIECDVSMTKDSVLVLMHDKTVDRTTTGKGNITDLLYEAVKKLRLVDNDGAATSFSIPTLDETLAWGKGKVLFTLDVKRGVPFSKVMAAVEKYAATDYAAIITYRIQDAKLVYDLNPNVIISVSAGNDGALAQINQAGIPVKNLLGFVGTREPAAAHYQKLQQLGIKTILGTLGNLDKSAAANGNDSVYLTYIRNGANIIATDRPLEVARVLYKK